MKTAISGARAKSPYEKEERNFLKYSRKNWEIFSEPPEGPGTFLPRPDDTTCAFPLYVAWAAQSQTGKSGNFPLLILLPLLLSLHDPPSHC